MKFNRYKCFLVAAALSVGMSLTACGANGGQTAQSEAAETEAVETADVDDKADVSEEDGSSVQSESTEAAETVSEAADNTDEGSSDKAEAESAESSNDKAEDAITMYTTESITLHKEASGSGEELGVIAVGSTVQAYETSGDYIRVSFDGKEGYVLKDYVTEDKEAADKALQTSIDSSKKEKKSSDKKKKEECLDNGLLN